MLARLNALAVILSMDINFLEFNAVIQILDNILIMLEDVTLVRMFIQAVLIV